MSSPGQFRGIHNGGWKKGYLSYDYKRSEYLIVNSQGSWPVLLESVGQYTGLKDKNGVEIYEGDIIRGYVHNPTKKFIVVFRATKYNCGFVATEIGKDSFYCHLWYEGFEVIGDIHTTPELLENE